MRDFTFVFDDHETVKDAETGLGVPLSFTVAAPDYETALKALVAHCSEVFDWSDDPTYYQNDIDDGGITVLLPTRITTGS